MNRTVLYFFDLAFTISSSSTASVFLLVRPYTAWERRSGTGRPCVEQVSRLSLERTPVRPQSAARLFFSLVAVAPQRIAHLPNV
jgi:hypothetical protein